MGRGARSKGARARQAGLGFSFRRLASGLFEVLSVFLSGLHCKNSRSFSSSLAPSRLHTLGAFLLVYACGVRVRVRGGRSPVEPGTLGLARE